MNSYTLYSCSSGQELYENIVLDIIQKFGIDNPVFEYNEERFYDNDLLIKWINKQEDGHRWVQYKHLQNNLFEIKDFSPNPTDSICHKLIADTVSELKKTSGSDELYFKIGNLIYDERQIYQEARAELRNGYSNIVCFKEAVFDKGYEYPIYKLEFYQGELGRDLKLGYLVLENNRS